MRQILLCLGVLVWAAGLNLGAARAETAGRSFDPAFLDRDVAPCQDFYQFACGAWRRANPIPEDQIRWGRFAELAIHNRDILHEILTEAAATPVGPARKVGDFYAACMDEAGIASRGLTPLSPPLSRIDAFTAANDLPALLAALHRAGVAAFFRFESEPDFKNARLNIAALAQGGLGLPDRDYYFKTDAKSVEQRTAYEAHIANMFALLGDPAALAATKASKVLAIETALARDQLNRSRRRDPSAVYHKETVAAWAEQAPGFDWRAYFKASGAPAFATLNVAEPAAIAAFATLVGTLSADDIRIYLTWHLLHRAAALLPSAFVDENFAFYGTVLTGTKEHQPRWRRCVIATDGALGEALGKLYVAKNYPPRSEQRISLLISDLKAAFAADIRDLPWMGPETKRFALGKLDAMGRKIGHPTQWRNYAALAVTRDDYLANSFAADGFEWARDLAKIGRPVDRLEWSQSPPTVNAYYSFLRNDINFPAGILQPPFFDPAIDDAINYGAIGIVIGHEMTHGFDDRGRQFDKDGNLQNWWTKEDAARFETRAHCIVDQYSGYAPLEGVNLNGTLTLGENTADNGGARIAFRALSRRLKHAKPAMIDGFTPEQRFFLGFAQVWCENDRPEATRLQVLTDPHSTPAFRVNGVVSNMPEFKAAFACKADDPMVRPNACRVW